MYIIYKIRWCKTFEIIRIPCRFINHNRTIMSIILCEYDNYDSTYGVKLYYVIERGTTKNIRKS